MQRIPPGRRLAVFAIVGALAGAGVAASSLGPTADEARWGLLVYAAPLGMVIGAMWAAAVWLVVGIVVASARRLRPTWLGRVIAVALGTAICGAVGLAPTPLETTAVSAVVLAALGFVGSLVEAVMRAADLAPAGA